jgi:hypothetical protein
VNRKDAEGMNIFQGGFLGWTTSECSTVPRPLPTGGHLEQSDGTSWMGMYCLNMLAIALELARENPAYESVASKFLEHFVHIAHAMNDRGGEGVELWDKEDGFYYDVLHLPNGERHYLKVRSLVGLIPLLAVKRWSRTSSTNFPGSSGACSGLSTIIGCRKSHRSGGGNRERDAAVAVSRQSRATRQRRPVPAR